MTEIPRRIRHKGICEHPQTHNARRICRKATIAAAATISQPTPAPEPVVTFRKNSYGDWCAYGPAVLIQIGQVTITRRDGSTVTERVARLGDVFFVDGVAYRHGYLASKTAGADATARPAYARAGAGFGAKSASRPRGRRACITGGNCSSHSGRNCGGWNCDAN